MNEPTQCTIALPNVPKYCLFSALRSCSETSNISPFPIFPLGYWGIRHIGTISALNGCAITIVCRLIAVLPVILSVEIVIHITSVSLTEACFQLVKDKPCALVDVAMTHGKDKVALFRMVATYSAHSSKLRS